MAPASKRVMSNRLVTRRVRRSISVPMRTCSSCRSASVRESSGSERIDDATFMLASGVLRSCETDPTRAWRNRSTSSSSSERNACSRSWARSSARAAWLANVRSSALSASDAGTPRMARMPTGRPAAVSATARTSSGSSGSPGAVPRLTGMPERGSRRWSSSGVNFWPEDAATTRRSASGTSTVTPGRSKTELTARAVVFSSSSTEVSSTSSSDSSKRRRVSTARCWACERAASRSATTRATASMTTA